MIGRFVLRRLGIAVLQLLGVALAVFFLIRLLPADPVARLVGLNASEEAYAQAERTLGLDPTDSMNPRWTVEQVLTEPLDLHTTLSAAEKRKRMTALLEMVGIDPAVREVKPRQLGAGRQQRIAIARALATEPNFIVLDEPTSALSP